MHGGKWRTLPRTEKGVGTMNVGDYSQVVNERESRAIAYPAFETDKRATDTHVGFNAVALISLKWCKLILVFFRAVAQRRSTPLKRYQQEAFGVHYAEDMDQDVCGYRVLRRTGVRQASCNSPRRFFAANTEGGGGGYGGVGVLQAEQTGCETSLRLSCWRCIMVRCSLA